MGLTGAASAASLPSCATGSHCTTFTAGSPSLTEPGGVAGYYGADDNHTHYRFVQTTVVAAPQLVDLNGPGSSAFYPATVGADLCDPNDGITAQISLGFWNGKYQVGYYVGRGHSAADPCTQDNFVAGTINVFRVGTLLGLNGISAGDKVYLGIYYTPSGRHLHQLSFGACDITTGICRQAYTTQRTLEFWEFGVGTFLPLSVLTGGAVNQFETFSATDVTCYACPHYVPISSVSPVNPFGAGGLYESQTANSSSQVVLSPKDTLSGDTFTMWNGSTSI